MIIDAPHDVARAMLALEDLEAFVIRYSDMCLRVVAEVHNTSTKLDTDNKETRDTVLGSLLERINKIVIGDTAEAYKPWPLVQLAALPIGLSYRSQLIYLLAKQEVSASDIVDFINTVYFPILDLRELKVAVLEHNARPHCNSAATHQLILSLANQVTMLATASKLYMEPTALTEEVE